jgi:hypothetical protein
LVAIRLCPLDRLDLYAPVVFVFLLGLLVATMMRPGLLRPIAFQILLLALVVLDLLSFGRGYNPTIEDRYFYPDNEILEPVHADPLLFRTTALGYTLPPDAHMMMDLSDIRGMDYATHWQMEYHGLTRRGSDWELPYGMILPGFRSPLVRVLNLRYVVTDASPRVEQDPGLQRQSAKGVLLNRIDNFQPRSFMVFDAVHAADDAEAKQMLRQNPQQVFRRVVLSDAPDAPTLSRQNLGEGRVPGGESSNETVVRLIGYAAHAASWQVTTSQFGYLVTTDSFYPGWKAFLDGEQVPIYRANLAFRAIGVPPGKHTIEYRYESATFRWGLVLAVLSLTSIAVLGSLGRSRTHLR